MPKKCGWSRPCHNPKPPVGFRIRRLFFSGGPGLELDTDAWEHYYPPQMCHARHLTDHG
jgi:hypothetical protein